MSLITKDNLSLTLKAFKALLSQKLGREDYFTDEEILQFLSDSINLSPITENGAFLIEGKDYLII